MAVFFDHCISADLAGVYTHTTWHPIERLLAIGVLFDDESGAGVYIFNETGDSVGVEPLKQGSAVSILQWHPTKLVLCVAWKDGAITLWRLDAKETSHMEQVHSTAVTSLCWSSFGARIVSGDESGTLLIWKVDSKGRAMSKPVSQHNLPEPIQQIILQPLVNPESYTEVRNLVRAAVKGDQKALDMFDLKGRQSDTKYSSIFGMSESFNFFCGGATGGVYHILENGTCTTLFSVSSRILNLFYYTEQNILVTLTHNLMLSQHKVDSQTQKAEELMKVKLNGKSENPCIVWAGKGMLAMASGESVIRMFDLDKEENDQLSLENHQSYVSNEQILSVDFCPRRGMLAGGTQMGNVAMWSRVPSAKSTTKKGREMKWKLHSPNVVGAPVRMLTWCESKNLLCVNTWRSVLILRESSMCYHLNHQIAMIQISPTTLSIDAIDTGQRKTFECHVQVKGIYTTKGNFVVWNGKQAHVYEFSADNLEVRVLATFETDSVNICIFEQSLLLLEQGTVKVRTFQGTVKQFLDFSEGEGQPVCLDISENFLVIATDRGILKLFDLSRRKIRPHSVPKPMCEFIPDLGRIVSVKSNCTGSRISLLCMKTNEQPDTNLYVWDVELDKVLTFSFDSSSEMSSDGGGDHIGEEKDDSKSHGAGDATPDGSNNQIKVVAVSKGMTGRYPVSHFWDAKVPHLLSCEARLITEDTNNKMPTTGETEAEEEEEEEEEETGVNTEVVVIVSLFATDRGLLLQETSPLNDPDKFVIGLNVPYFYILQDSEEKNWRETPTPTSPPLSEPMQKDDSQGSLNYIQHHQHQDQQQPTIIVARRTMRDFVGLETCDKGTQSAMLEFCFHQAIGNMDEAFKAIKLIKNESVWENMAKMCVKTQQLDVAKICLGKMCHAQGVRALRKMAHEPEVEVQLAVLAMHLNMADEAEKFLKNCKRYDLLNEFYQDCGQWDKALETAELYDRIHLKCTYHCYAQHLQSEGIRHEAINNYKKAGTHMYEVPKMLYPQPQDLLDFIQKSKDKTLYKWYAQYMESIEELAEAVKYYDIAQDYLSLVRVYCFQSDMEKASTICNETGDRAACYHVARQYEIQGDYQNAVNFFTRSETYGNAIRLCKENGMENQILNLALLGSPEDMVEAARYFEHKLGMEGNAVMLYHKAGRLSKALELSFSSKQFGALQAMTLELDDRADPEVLERCADFFMENAQYDKAVELLAMAKKYWEAIQLLMEKSITVTPELAEKLSPPKNTSGGPDSGERLKILEGIGKICMLQGQYHLATKKYTQSGNRVKAMKCLLKSGDTEKISFFANVSRQREIYVMAANYLQSLDWRNNTDIMKNIVNFYMKAKALDSLAAFYDVCAQAEIDEYQNYEKSLGALGEACKCLQKYLDSDNDGNNGNNDDNIDNKMHIEYRLDELKQKVVLIKKFVNARKIYSNNPDDAVKLCLALLEEPNLEKSVRVGDVYAFLIEHYACQERWRVAYDQIEELKKKFPKMNVTYFVSPKTVEQIYQHLDIPLPKELSSANNTDSRKKTSGQLSESPCEEDDEFVEEDIPEVY
ncbi:intraflagellar transport protein 140 homolog [Octopus bimaculoides]|nr:intraflagellar transport protein 140 homolog [Octopus bimaculoides]XP_052833891.1 intraflagellar transport protein 140 homolog [Octopus bimaculoides]